MAWMMSNTESNLSHCPQCFVYGYRPSVWLTNDILLVVDYYYFVYLVGACFLAAWQQVESNS